MALKNQNIASANPASIANRAYIDALYKEKLGQYATDTEYNRFKSSTVKDAANIILGQSLSPFTNDQMMNAAYKNLQAGKLLDARTGLPVNQSGVPIPAGATAINPGGAEGSAGANGTPSEGTPTSPIPTTAMDEATRKRITDFINTEYKDMSETERSFLIATFVNSDNYTSGRAIPSNSQIATWITDSATLAAADTNPYYQKITAEELQDYRNKMADIRNESQRYAQSEAASYKQTLATTKQSLRARGATYSGINRATLGKESAIDNAGLEGSLASSRRMAWEDKSAGWQEKARDIGLAAERELGSATLGNEGGLASPYDRVNLGGDNIADYTAGRTQALYDPNRAGTTGYYAGIGNAPRENGYTSTHELQRLKDIELAKQQKIRQFQLTI